VRARDKAYVSGLRHSALVSAFYMPCPNNALPSAPMITMPTLEGDILKPVESSITNSDEWEIFTLSNAQVVYESNGKPANLLAAYADTPLKVQGTFAPSRGQVKCCTLLASPQRTRG
jgi:hypothetical protein